MCGKIQVRTQDPPKEVRRVVNEDLPEVIVLGDDVGKSPFLRSPSEGRSEREVLLLAHK